MIVPQFWAESRMQQRVGPRQITVRRFGWSDTSPEDAQSHADGRAREAFDRIASGEKLPRREPKRAYNGAEGVPIREEIVGRHGETIVTRNVYGARCLNTPNVLFVDIDYAARAPELLTCGTALLFCFASAGLGAYYYSLLGAVVAAVAGVVLGVVAAQGGHRLANALSGGPERRARRRLEQFLRSHPDWHLRVYRTPAGLRLLAMHRTFDPSEPAVGDCFRALGADPIYARMCTRQHCFRARVSPKPWRIGIAAHIRPRPGVWPIAPERMAERTRWIEAYEKAARHYAACQLVETLGSQANCPETIEVQQLHDELSRADTGFPIA